MPLPIWCQLIWSLPPIGIFKVGAGRELSLRSSAFSSVLFSSHKHFIGWGRETRVLQFGSFHFHCIHMSVCIFNFMNDSCFDMCVCAGFWDFTSNIWLAWLKINYGSIFLLNIFFVVFSPIEWNSSHWTVNFVRSSNVPKQNVMHIAQLFVNVPRIQSSPLVSGPTI